MRRWVHCKCSQAIYAANPTLAASKDLPSRCGGACKPTAVGGARGVAGSNVTCKVATLINPGAPFLEPRCGRALLMEPQPVTRQLSTHACVRTCWNPRAGLGSGPTCSMQLGTSSSTIIGRAPPPPGGLLSGPAKAGRDFATQQADGAAVHAPAAGGSRGRKRVDSAAQRRQWRHEQRLETGSSLLRWQQPRPSLISTDCNIDMLARFPACLPDCARCRRVNDALDSANAATHLLCEPAAAACPTAPSTP